MEKSRHKTYTIDSLNHPPIDSWRCKGRSQWYNVMQGSMPAITQLPINNSCKSRTRLRMNEHTLVEKSIYNIIVVLNSFNVSSGTQTIYKHQRNKNILVILTNHIKAIAVVQPRICHQIKYIGKYSKCSQTKGRGGCPLILHRSN